MQIGLSLVRNPSEDRMALMTQRSIASNTSLAAGAAVLVTSGSALASTAVTINAWCTFVCFYENP